MPGDIAFTFGDTSLFCPGFTRIVISIVLFNRS
ncbi:MAG: hypothetical protein CMD54_00355 [Gammaproteobacteria bacterium]|nr:hypothetical protein [Gammaproteobacteria bacterium]HAN80201.1 hypothetical protein [Gammaproteobacteria bacterium]